MPAFIAAADRPDATDARPEPDAGQISAQLRAQRRSNATAPTSSPCALLLVDWINPMQFDGAQAFRATALAAAAHAARLKRQLAARGVPAVFVSDHPAGQPWHSDFAALRDQCLRSGGMGGALATLLAPQPGDLTLLKPRHSAFYGTPLQLLLTQLGTRLLIVCGLATDSCVQFSAMDAFQRGFDLWVPSNCTTAQTATRKRVALAWMQRTLQARIAPATGKAVAQLPA